MSRDILGQRQTLGILKKKEVVFYTHEEHLNEVNCHLNDYGYEYICILNILL